ncbi:amine GPCR [Clonorchis sinensis]|uniref:Amine GPCR n=1 Tax=Clonorchis sinensis TaxID=79923 RepID=H2KTD3_CLOSI|nr:amine GPCR [Clonorchis sinensis]
MDRLTVDNNFLEDLKLQNAVMMQINNLNAIIQEKQLRYPTGQTSASMSVQPADQLVGVSVKNHMETVIATTVMLSLISVVGIVGNILVVWAFRCHASQGIVTSMLILTLACLDLLICVVGIPSTLYLDVWLGETTDIICRIHMAFKGFIVPVSACVLVFIALERFFLICFIPGFELKRIHLTVAFISMLCFGIMLAIPMGLHVKSSEIAKDRDELLHLALQSSKTNMNSPKQTAVHIPRRCVKDDRYVGDTIYWYFQVVVMFLFAFLFFSLVCIYGVIFLFVWRHESLMFERYGKSKYRGYWIRIHASSKQSTQRPSQSKHSSTQPSKEESESLKKAEDSCGSRKDQKLERIRCACLCDSKQIDENTETQYTSLRNVSKASTDSNKKLGKIVDYEASQSESYKGHNVIESANWLPESSAPSSRTNNSNPNKTCCWKSPTSVTVVSGSNESGDAVQHPIKIKNEDIKSPFPKHEDYIARTKWAAQTMERRRRPHVHAAQTFALIAAAFVISYSPYLIYTSMPVTKRNIRTVHDEDRWYVQVGRVAFYMYFINSALNPIIYSCTNRHFRTRLVEIVSRFRDVCSVCTCKSPNTKDDVQQKGNLKQLEMQSLSGAPDSTFEKSERKQTDL